MGKWVQFGKYDMLTPNYKKAVITKPFIYFYEPNNKEYDSPVGAYTNGISSPKELAFILDTGFEGSPLPAAIIHDRRCQLGLTGKADCSMYDTHRMFYEAMLDNGVPKWGINGAYLKYKAVQIWGLFHRWKYYG